MNVLIDSGRIRGARTGLGEVSLQFAGALMRANVGDMDFHFLTYPAFAEFADNARSDDFIK